MKPGFPWDDRCWREAAEALARIAAHGDLILAPAEFTDVHNGVIADHVRKHMLHSAVIRHFVLHKGMLSRVDPEMLLAAVRLRPVFANEVFVVFSETGEILADAERHHLQAFHERLSSAPGPAASHRLGVVITTYNRPWALERTLESSALRNQLIVVVDDGSTAENGERNARLCAAANALHVAYPVNVGLSHALNVGISHLLSDREIGWISTFNDDVEVRSDAFEILARVTAASPFSQTDILCTGFADPRHAIHSTIECDGISVQLARSASAKHLHAHRAYWQEILPIPTAYVGAPKKTGGIFPGHGSDADWWTASWAPSSSLKRCGAVLVIPELVSTFARGAFESTWSNPG